MPCVCVCVRLHSVAGKYHLKSAEIRESHIKPIVGRRTSGTTFAVILFERRQRLFFFFFKSGIVILEGHLPPQRQTSLNSSGRQTVTGVMETRPAGLRAQLSD